MRKVLLIVAALVAWGFWRSGDSQQQILDRLPGAGDPNRVLMVSAEWCGYCKRQIAELDAAAVHYRVLDFDQPDGRALVTDLDGRGVPLTVIGDHVIKGYDRPVLQKHLSAIGYQLR